MKRTATYIIFLFILISTQSLIRNNHITYQKPYFGVSLNTSPMSNDMTFAIITPTPDGRKNVRHISRNDFLHIASGAWKHPVNPERRNLFEENKVFGGLFIDTLTDEKTYFCPALDSLWKVKHSTNPYFFKSVGWAHGNYMPSLEQQKYLWDEYGVYNLHTDFFADTSFWKLLRDVSRPEWITNYTSL